MAEAGGGSLSPRQMSRAINYSIVAGGSSAFFLTVCNNQPIFNVYMLNHLGVSPELLGLLIGFMQLSGVLQLVSIVAYSLLPRRKALWMAGHLIHRLAGLAVAASAAIFASGAGRAPAALIVSAAMIVSWTAMNLTSAGWMSWMADLIPAETRGSFFLRRSAVFQGVTVVWFFLASLLLDFFPDGSRSWAYVAIFGMGALGGVLDILLHLAIPEPKRVARPHFTPAEFIAPLRDGNFLRYALSIGLAVLALNLASPFQAPYVTAPEAIGAANVWLGIMTVISQLTWVAIAPLWGFLMDRYGRKPVVLMGILVGLGNLGYVFLTPGDYVYVLPLLSIAIGFFGPAFWEGSNQLMLTLAPPEHRVVYISWYNTIIGLVSAVGPIGGGYLARVLADFRVAIGPAEFRGFHVGQVASLVILGLAALALHRVKEGSKRPVAYLVSQFATAGVFRSFASLGDLSRDSSDPRVARALRRIDSEGGELVLREVIERLDDPSAEVRREAARALGRIGSARATEELVCRLTDTSSPIRIEAARALGEIGDERAVPPLVRCLAVDSSELRAACAEALGSIGGETASSALAAGLSGEEDRSVVAMLAEAVSKTAGTEDAEAPVEMLEAVQELFPRLTESHNAALKRQYAIALGNTLGRPGEFYRFITGEASSRQARCRTLFASFRLHVEPLLADESSADAKKALDECGQAIETERGRDAMAACLRIHGMLMSRLFGRSASTPDFPEKAGRIDMRLGAWSWLANEAARKAALPEGEAEGSAEGAASRKAEDMDDATCLMIALLGLYYLGSGI
jgi:MFS family permease